MYDSYNLAKNGLAHPLKGKGGGTGVESRPRAFPCTLPWLGGGGREEVKARTPPAPVGRARGQGRGGCMVGTHSVELNAKNSVHPLDEATEYLV